MKMYIDKSTFFEYNDNVQFCITDGFADNRKGMQNFIADRLGNWFAERTLIVFL